MADGAIYDAALADSALDAAIADALSPDAVPPDAMISDAALPDAALPDAALSDAALPDAALSDAALPADAMPSCSWSAETASATSDGSKPGVAVDPAGGVHIMFYDTTASGSLNEAYKAAGATAWTVSMVDIRLGSDSKTLSVAADSAGGVHVSYFKNQTGTSGMLRYAFKPAGGAWGTFQVDGQLNVGLQSSIDIDTAGVVHIAYSASEPGTTQTTRLGYAHGNLGIWTLARVPTTATQQLFGGFPSLRVDARGNVHISCLDTDGNNTESLIYAELPSGGSWSVTTVDGAGRAGVTSGLDVDASGGVHIAYWGSLNEVLRYADKPAGGSWTATTIDPTNVLSHQALRIDRAGTIHIVYMSGDPFHGIPFQIHHASAPAGGAWTFEVAGPDTGVFGPTLALGPSDTLHAAYAQGSAVRYAHRVCP